MNGQHLPNKVELLVAVHRRLVKCGGPAAATAQALACATLEAKIGWLMTVGGLTAQEAVRAWRDAGDADARTAFNGAGKVICPRTEDAAALLGVRPPRPRAKRRTRRRPVATQADQIRGGTMVARKRETDVAMTSVRSRTATRVVIGGRGSSTFSLRVMPRSPEVGGGASVVERTVMRGGDGPHRCVRTVHPAVERNSVRRKATVTVQNCQMERLMPERTVKV